MRHNFLMPGCRMYVRNSPNGVFEWSQQDWIWTTEACLSVPCPICWPWQNMWPKFTLFVSIVAISPPIPTDWQMAMPWYYWEKKYTMNPVAGCAIIKVQPLSCRSIFAMGQTGCYLTSYNNITLAPNSPLHTGNIIEIVVSKLHIIKKKNSVKN